MTEAIVIKYLGPTATKGARLRAHRYTYPFKTVPRDYSGPPLRQVEALAKEYAANVLCLQRPEIVALHPISEDMWVVVVRPG
jgi:hypothetical protein